MNLRNFNPNETEYGFNGMRKENSLGNGSDSHLDFGARIYDSRTGKWLAIDAYYHNYPRVSHYSYANNNPIYYVDNEGNTVHGWAKLNKTVFASAVKVLKSSETFINVLAAFQSVKGDGFAGKVVPGVLADVDLVINTTEKVFAKDGSEVPGLLTVSVKGDADINNLQVSDIVINVDLKDYGTQNDLDEGDRIVVMLHEIAIHLETVRSKLLEIKKMVVFQKCCFR